ncbi:MAG: NAD(P)-binding domain-containing protein [Gammaproteobacteria bacterium]|nr:NAD(P)-binding domain-containing protein [Gammaproteobacteria bacterium]MDH5730388.1 NAD(P)-binding domain-containing protein [Gammaproteobacteria bacterium]
MDITISGWWYFALFVVFLAWARYRTKRLKKVKIPFQANSLVLSSFNLPNIHPVINDTQCIGCGSCARACPEQNVIAIIHDKARLINASQCLGHGACVNACPMGAIHLAFDRSTRGNQLPQLNPQFESEIPGLFIVGELAGMGLIRNAMEQAKQAINNIRMRNYERLEHHYDVLIIGAGPAGLAASICADHFSLSYITLEQAPPGEAVAHFPRQHLSSAHSVSLPKIGKIQFGDLSKSTLVNLWRKLERETKVRIRYRETVEKIIPQNKGFVIKTNLSSYRCMNVLLAAGRGGSPRKLNIPGEHLTKVVYQLDKPRQYANQHVAVVGATNEAVETALKIAQLNISNVSLIYSAETLSKVSKFLITQLIQAEQIARIKIFPNSQVTEIKSQYICLLQKQQFFQLKNQIVIVCLGRTSSSKLLHDLKLCDIDKPNVA